MERNLSLDGSRGVGTPGRKPPNISNEVAKEGLLEPWDDAPCRNSKTAGYHEKDCSKDILSTMSEQELEREKVQTVCNIWL